MHSLVDQTFPPAPFPAPLWEQLPNEPFRAFAAFKQFRDFGPDRTIRAAWARTLPPEKRQPKKPVMTPFGALPQKDDCRPGQWFVWSKKYDWFQRVKAFDQHLRAQRGFGLEESEEEMYERFAREEIAELEALEALSLE